MRSADNVNWITITSNTQSTTTTFTDANLTPSSDYWYVVAAINSLGNGQDSTVQQGSTFGPPEPITSFGSTSTSSTITLNWTAPNDHGSAITNYRIEALSFSTGQWINLDTVGGGTTTWTQSSTLSNTEYTYRLVAINAYGSSTSAQFTQYS